jgi:uncharacterized repeat protein (TIGR03803 family)
MSSGASKFAALLLFAGLIFGSFAQVRAQEMERGAKAQPETTFTHSIVYSFCSKSGCTDGEDIEAGLIQASDGNFWGTTYGGGTNDSGTVYKVTSAGVLTTVYNFCSVGDCTDGSNPHGGVVEGGDGNFYGTTYYGGTSSNGGGVVFKLTPAGVLTTLYSFCSKTNCTDGSLPQAGVVEGTDGDFYGTTVEGGLTNSDLCSASGGTCGTLYKVTSSGTLTTLYSFCSLSNCSDGTEPEGTLVEGSDGNFYGTTFAGGGSNSGGSAFKYSPSAKTLTTIYDFCSAAGCEDGADPNAGLFEGGDGNYYGTTSIAGTNAQGGLGGTAFKMSAAGAISILYGFCNDTNCSDGDQPYDVNLFEGSDGNFYGATLGGGADEVGTAFRITSGGALTQLYSFTGASGESPFAGPVQGSDGNMYATTETGGANSSGTVYKLTISPALAAPVQLTFSSSSIALGSSSTLTWKSLNSFSETMQLCYAFVQGGASGAGTWTGSKIGTLSSGIYSGTAMITPTAVGTYTYALTCGGMESGFATLTVTASSTLEITTTSLAAGTVGTAYSQTLEATGGDTPYTWSISVGTLPAGLTLAASTGVISGTPTTAGTSDFTVKVTDSDSHTATAALSIVIDAASSLKVTTSLLATAAVGIAYSATLQASGGTSPYTWSLSAGTLPAGLTLASSTGVISGTPTTAVASDAFTVKVTDSASNTATAALSLTVFGSTIVRITTTSLPNWTVGKAYSVTMAATSGTKPYTWSVYSGSLPAGLSLAASTGVISGTPTTAGTTTFFIGVKGAGANTATAQFTVVISAAPVVATMLLETGAVGIAYSTTLAVMGGTSPYTWSLSTGTLPAGLTLAASTGVISGKPTTAVTADAFTVKATDAAGATASQALTLTIYIADDVRITTTSLPNGTVGTAYSATLMATSGTKPYTWSVYSGSLPAGLSLAASTGVISGTPTEAGTTDFFIGVKGAGANTATASLSITIVQ